MGQPNSIGVREDVTLGALAGLIKTAPPMTSHPIFCDARLAKRIESAEAQLIAEASHAAHRRAPGGDGFLLPIAGGVASFAEQGSPFNKVAGLGFDGVPGAADLDRVEHAFSERREPTQVELSSLADPAVAEVLGDRSYRLAAFENVLGTTLDRNARTVAPAGIEVRRGGEADLDRWVEVIVTGFETPDEQGVRSQENFPRDVIERAERDFVAVGVIPYVALHRGVIAGGAGLRIAGDIAQLAGAATAPEHRRQGIHTALMEQRLSDAGAAGSDIAVVTTQPGSKSQQNVQRCGFSLLYTRAVLVKKG